MTSLNFLKGVFIVFPLTLLISFKLKILIPKYLLGLYYTNLKTFLIIRPLISYYWDFLNGPFRVVITLSFYSFRNSSILAYSLWVIKVIKILSSSIAAMNWLLKSAIRWCLLRQTSCWFFLNIGYFLIFKVVFIFII